jgi:hypothetical protein
VKGEHDHTMGLVLTKTICAGCYLGPILMLPILPNHHHHGYP